MKKQVIIKEDGRKLIYYSFAKDEQADDCKKQSGVNEISSQEPKEKTEKGN